MYSSALTFNLFNSIATAGTFESLSHIDTSNISPCCQATTHLSLRKLVGLWHEVIFHPAGEEKKRKITASFSLTWNELWSVFHRPWSALAACWNFVNDLGFCTVRHWFIIIWMMNSRERHHKPQSGLWCVCADCEHHTLLCEDWCSFWVKDHNTSKSTSESYSALTRFQKIFYESFLAFSVSFFLGNKWNFDARYRSKSKNIYFKGD